MSRFVDQLFIRDTGHRSIRQQPLSLRMTKDVAYSTHDSIVMDYDIKTVFSVTARVPEKNEQELLENTRKMLIEHIYGDLKGMLHEVRMHLHNHDFEEAQRAMRDVFREIDG